MTKNSLFSDGIFLFLWVLICCACLPALLTPNGRFTFTEVAQKIYSLILLKINNLLVYVSKDELDDVDNGFALQGA